MTDSDHWGGTWTEVKVKVLRGYLQSYQTALKSTSFHKSYIDALAGDGTWRERNTPLGPLWGLEESERQAAVAFREGTALAAIGVEPPFDRFVFNDLDGDKALALRQRAEESGRPSGAIEIRTTDVNKFILEYCRTLDPQRHRGVIMVDPWGMQTEWSTIEHIAATHCLDMWYLFPTQAVVRMLPHSGVPIQTWCDKLNACLGTENWKSCAGACNRSFEEQLRLILTAFPPTRTAPIRKERAEGRRSRLRRHG